jgi:hypothetical protein
MLLITVLIVFSSSALAKKIGYQRPSPIALNNRLLTKESVRAVVNLI